MTPLISLVSTHFGTVCTPLKLHQWSPWHGHSILENHAGNRRVFSFGCWCQTCFSTLFGMMVRKCPRYLYTFSGGWLKPATNRIWMYMVSVFTTFQKVPGPGCSRQLGTSLAAADPGDWTAARAAPKATGSCRVRVAWSCLMKAGAKFRFIILYACLKRQDLQQDMGIGKTHTSAHPNGTRMMMMMMMMMWI